MMTLIIDGFLFRSFHIQLPIILLGFLYMIFFFEDETAARKESWRQKLKRVDFAGAVAIIIDVASLLLGLDQGSEQSWTAPSTITCLCLSAFSFGLFGYVEDQLATEPFVPRRVIMTRTAGACLLCNFIIFGWWLSILFNLPLLWEATEGTSGSAIALRLLPGIIAGVVASLFAGVVSCASTVRSQTWSMR